MIEQNVAPFFEFLKESEVLKKIMRWGMLPLIMTDWFLLDLSLDHHQQRMGRMTKKNRVVILHRRKEGSFLDGCSESPFVLRFRVVNKLQQMRLVDRNPMGRKLKNKIVPSLTSVERQDRVKPSQSDPIDSPQRYQYHPNDLLLKVTPQTPPNKINFMGDKTITTHVDTNAVYDSVKYPVTVEGITEWKILTLKQLRRDVSRSKRESESREKSKEKRGIHVSLSKENRKAVSCEKVGEVAPNSENRDYSYLKKLSGRGRLIDKIELQMGEPPKDGLFFC